MALIDRDALIEEFRNMEGYYALGEGQEPLAVKDIVEVINDADSVDAVQVAHGEWIRDHGDYGKLICSRCECRAGYRAKETELGYNIFNVSPSNFCPNCGADMRERK